METGDLDELVGRVNHLMSHHTVLPAREGRFSAQISGFQTPGLSMFHMDYGMPLRLRAAPLDDYLAISLPLTGSMRVSHKGTSFTAEAERVGFVGTPEDELVMDWDEDLTLLVMRVELTDLRRFAGRLLTAEDGELDRLRFDPIMAPAATAATLSQARLMQELVGVADAGEVNPLAAAQVREQVMGTLLLGQDNTWSDTLRHRGRSRSPRSTVRDAAELMAARAGEPIGIAEIAREVGLSVRALHAGFRREFGCSPKQHLQRLRLDRAHAELQAGTELRVIDVAYRWGFSNPGRFAGAYRERFGTSPAGDRGDASRRAPSRTS